MKKIYKDSILAEKNGRFAEYRASKYADRYYATVLYQASMYSTDLGNKKGYKTERGALNACKKAAAASGWKIIEA